MKKQKHEFYAAKVGGTAYPANAKHLRDTSNALRYILALDEAYHCACLVEAEGGIQARSNVIRRFIDRVRRDMHKAALPAVV